MTTALPLSILLSKTTPTENQISINILRIIQKELTKKEIMKIDMRFMGDIILGQAKALSLRVDHELLKPIGIWLNDSDWMKKFLGQSNEKPDWAKYKQQSRQWTKQQKHLARERLKHYWKAIHEKRIYQTKLSGILNEKGKTQDGNAVESYRAIIDTAFLSDIVAPFSPVEKHREEIAIEFTQAYKLSISDLLPWKTILISELTETRTTTLDDLKIYVTKNKKLDTISKFQHLLQLEMNGDICLKQFDHASQIQIFPKPTNQKSAITIKDKSGQSYNYNWPSLNNGQRNKIITDAIERKILCRSVYYK
jgi:hypothetical protein